MSHRRHYSTHRALPLVLVLSFLLTARAGQERGAIPVQPVQTEQGGPASIFGAVEQGLRDGDDRVFAAYFSRTVSLNVRGSSPGYYSANQAGQVLRHLLSGRKAPAFRFSTVDTGAHPYATGSIAFPGGGPGERAQVYVGLMKERYAWVISQFNVY